MRSSFERPLILGIVILSLSGILFVNPILSNIVIHNIQEPSSTSPSSPSSSPSSPSPSSSREVLNATSTDQLVVQNVVDSLSSRREVQSATTDHQLVIQNEVNSSSSRKVQNATTDQLVIQNEVDSLFLREVQNATTITDAELRQALERPLLFKKKNWSTFLLEASSRMPLVVREIRQSETYQDAALNASNGIHSGWSCPTNTNDLLHFQEVARPLPKQMAGAAEKRCNLPRMLQHTTFPLERSMLVSSEDDDEVEQVGCNIYFFDPASACSLLINNPDLTILLVGDSLIREILVGLGITLTGDMKVGGIEYVRKPSSDESEELYRDDRSHWHRLCACENQWTCALKKNERYIGNRFGYNPTTFANVHNLCRKRKAGNPQQHEPPPSYQIMFLQMNHAPKITQQLQAIANHTRGQVVIISDASALHGNLNISLTRDFFSELNQLFRPPRHHRLLILPMTVHYVGRAKPSRFLSTQGNPSVQAYNSALRQWAADNGGVPVLETYNLTQDLPSRDGVHYPSASVALSQFLLNYILRYANVTLP
jgi:hypothetical protein